MILLNEFKIFHCNVFANDEIKLIIVPWRIFIVTCGLNEHLLTL